MERLNGAKNWLRRPSERDDADAQVMEPSKLYEEAVARDSVRCQIWWLLLEVTLVIVLKVMSTLKVDVFSDVWVGPPIFVAIGVRMLSLLIGCRRTRVVHVLAVFCMLLDTAALSLSHPSVQTRLPWCSEPPEVPSMDALLGLRESWEAWEEEHDDDDRRLQAIPPHPGTKAKTPKETLAEIESEKLKELVKEHWRVLQLNNMYFSKQTMYKEKATGDYRLIVYLIVMMLWVMTTFAFLLRHALVTVPSALLIYFATLFFAESDTSIGISSKYGLMEIPLLILTAVVCLLAKTRLETSQRKMFHFLEQQKGEIVHQKVLRCKAEFATAVLQDGMPGDARKIDHTFSPRKVMPVAESTMAASTLASFRTAPGRMWGLSNTTGGSRGDCLPLDCQVWVEGRPLPKKARDVVAGERVLCHDAVVGAPKYVEIVESRVLTGDTDWVNIILKDGTRLTVTANHPVLPKSQAGRSQEPIHAADLEPGIDSLMVLKMVPLLVEDVKSISGPALPPDPQDRTQVPTRVAIRLKHPQRYEVFVVNGQDATGGDSAGLAAVCSADLAAGPRAAIGGFKVKNTFLDEAEDGHGAVRRAGSEPPRGRKAPEEVRTLGKIKRGKDHGGETRPLQRTNSDSDIKSRVSGFTNLTPSYLDDVVYAQQMGLSSIGALDHLSGNCRPCIFQFKHQRAGAPPCVNGLLCEWCHESHEELPKRSRPSGGKRRIIAKAKKAAAQGSSPEGTPTDSQKKGIIGL